MFDRINERLRWITHKGNRILFHDFSGLGSDELADQVRQNEQDAVRIGKNEAQLLLVLTDVTDSVIYPASMEALKQLAENAKPYVKASAVIGVTGARRTLLEVVRRFSRRDITSFDSKDEALDWLVKHAAS